VLLVVYLSVSHAANVPVLSLLGCFALLLVEDAGTPNQRRSGQVWIKTRAVRGRVADNLSRCLLVGELVAHQHGGLSCDRVLAMCPAVCQEDVLR
jgi:hypothetical protein